MKKLLLLAICAVLSLIMFSSPTFAVDWSPFIIRDANTTAVQPTYSLDGGVLTVNVDSTTGGQKVGYGTSALDGKRLDCITRFQVIRLDDHPNDYAPYINIWVSDGNHYAVLSLEPSHYPEFDWTHDLEAEDYLSIEPWIYETDTSDLSWLLPGAYKEESVIKVAGVTQTIKDLGHLIIKPPTPDELAGGLPGVGSGAPRELDTNIAYGFNLVFGDTQANYVGGYEIDANPTLTACTEYGDISLSGGFEAGHFPEVWDLTACDMIISFKYDANGLVDDLGAHAWAALGIRAVGYSDFNPTWEVEGAGVWLATDYDWSANTFDPDPTGAPKLDMDDKLILQKGGGCGEGGYWYWDGTGWALTGGYNLPSVPPNPWDNHRIWWDRDGVDPWQNDETANTGGIYEIKITLHATSATSGEAYMTINGLDQGFETDGNWNTIELTPAGMTFTGDMTKMQVFYGLYGYGATHSIAFNNITVKGCLFPIIEIDGCNTGVLDMQYDGKPISEWIDECEQTAINHGKFVSCVAHLTNDLVADGIITSEEKDRIMECAAESDIGKK